MDRSCSQNGRRCFQNFNRYTTGKRPLVRPTRIWEDNIGMDLEEIDINTRNWVHSAQDTDYWRAVVNLQVS